jgi:uncharacterized repeat protein (TIGR01451 family)
LTTIVAMLGFAGLVYADGGHNNNALKHANAPKLVSDDPSRPGHEISPQGNKNLSAVPANDKCAGAIELFLGISQKVDSVGATDDYQTPATAGCYPDVPNLQGQHTQIPTTAPGRDVVFKFTAPAAGKYSVRLVVDGVTNDFRNQNGVLYLVDGPGCFGAGTVACLKGANREMSRAFSSAIGSANNHGEEVNCVSLAAGQTVYPVFDDFNAGNAGSNPKIEVIPCVEESEPNDTIEQANAYQCDLTGVTNVAPTAHCWLGSRDGQACRRTTPLDVSFAETDLDCDPRCVGGPNAGLVCSRTTPAIPNSNTFCNPVTDVGAFCAGTCVIDSVCVFGPTPGATCTATCNAGPRAGQFCSGITGCGTGFLCIQNLSCGNGTAQDPLPGKCTTENNEGDADFYSLGNVAAGSKVFTAIDANTANDYDWRMRVTNTTDTLQFDDDDGNFVSGDGAPVIAGAIATGGDTYIKVSKTQPRVSEPYHLNAIVRPPIADAQLESEFNANGINNTIYYYWPSNTIAAQAITAGGYIKGNFTAGDTDCWKFCVNKGDLMHWYGDGNPLRTFPPTLGQLAQPIPYDSDGAGISNFIFGANARKNDLPTVPSATLHGLTPAVTSSYETYRATYTGEIEVCMYEPSSRVTPAPVPSYSPGAWAGSLGVNCGPVDDCTTIPADISATKTVSPGPYHTGDIVTYTVVITNPGPGIAADVHFQDFLDPNTVYISLEVKDGFDKDGDGVESDNNGCFLLPTPGQNDAFIDCISASIAPGASVTYILKVQVNSCIGDIDIFNSATIDTRTPDPNTSTCDVLNIFTGSFDSLPCENPSVSFSATDIGTCNDIICDDVSCTANNCTSDSCVDGACVSVDNPPCDDQSICTADSCVPATGCVFDSSQLGDLCDNAGSDQCLEDYCDPVTFCQVRPVSCDDGNACTDDSCDSASGCQHAAHSCDDGNACTDDRCDPASGGCHNDPTAACDDGDCCTNDSCDPASGCTHSPNTTPPTFTTQPSLGACAILWPPNQGYVDFDLSTTGVVATSQCGIASIGFASCHSSQEENAHGTGDGNSTWDCAYSADTLSVRAARNGACSPLGRVYTSSVSATDVCGNTAVSNTFDIGVWHDRGHGPNLPHFSANPGSNQNDTRQGVAGFVDGTYGTGCGSGINPSCDEAGQQHDSSDADPEMEISQIASISVDNLKISKSGANALLTWTTPGAPGQVTRFHVYRLDPITLFWTQIAEVSKQTTSYLDPVLSDGLGHQYKIAAVIKP